MITRFCILAAAILLMAGQSASSADTDSEAADPVLLGGDEAVDVEIADPSYEEEVVVTAAPPEAGKTPSFAYLQETYTVRDRGAMLYLRGRFEEAYPYLLASAKRGFKLAQARVGFLSQQGLGTTQDPVAAVGFLGIAAKGTTLPEIRNHFRNLWKKIPDEMTPELENVIAQYESDYGADTHGVSCDLSYKAGTHLKRLTCRFDYDSVYQDFGDTLNDSEGIPQLGGGPGGGGAGAGAAGAGAGGPSF